MKKGKHTRTVEVPLWEPQELPTETPPEEQPIEVPDWPQREPVTVPLEAPARHGYSVWTPVTFSAPPLVLK